MGAEYPLVTSSSKPEKLVLDNAKLIFRNFSGQPSNFNVEGNRNFCVLLDTELANKLKSEGWNVRWNEGRIEGAEPQAYMQVAVSFKQYPPNIILVTKKNQTLLKEADVNILDWAEIECVDLTINPYSWEVNGNRGIKAYLKSMYVTAEEDKFAEKYAAIPFANAPSNTGVPIDVKEVEVD